MESQSEDGIGEIATQDKIAIFIEKPVSKKKRKVKPFIPQTYAGGGNNTKDLGRMCPSCDTVNHSSKFICRKCGGAI